MLSSSRAALLRRRVRHGSIDESMMQYPNWYRKGPPLHETTPNMRSGLEKDPEQRVEKDPLFGGVVFNNTVHLYCTYDKPGCMHRTNGPILKNDPFGRKGPRTSERPLKRTPNISLKKTGGCFLYQFGYLRIQ